MAVFVVKSGGWRRICKKAGDVYNVVDGLFKGTEPQVAMDAATWCVLASVGNVLEHNYFTVEVVASI